MTERKVSSERVSEELLREIIAGCEGVSPGPWVYGSKYIGRYVDGDKSRYEAIAVDARKDYDSEEWTRDASHIARLDPATVKAMASELLALRSSVKTVPEALEQLRIAVEAEAAAKAKRDQFLATIYVNVQKSEPTAEFAGALRDFVREEWPKLSAIEAPPSRLARNGWSCCKDIRESGRRERDDPCALCIEAPAAASEVTLEDLFRSTEGVDRNQPGYHHMCGWNDAIRHVMHLTAALKGDRP